MLCPEVWTFKPPASNYKETSGYFQRTNETYVPQVIKDFSYIHSISIVLPNVLQTLESLTDLLNSDSDYYKLVNISLAELINKDFIQNFIRNGSLTALSIGTRIDVDNCVSVTPEGILILSLDKRSFQELGLEGKVSQFAKNKKERYVVQLNLKSSSFTTNDKLLKRTRKCLAERLEKFTLIVAWQPDDENVCPSSVAKYFHDIGCNVRLCTPQFSARTKATDTLLVPNVRCGTDPLANFELTEWLGMVTLDADFETDAVEEFVTAYKMPEDCVRVKCIQCLEWKGLFTVHQVQQVYEMLTKFIMTSQNIPWVSLCVQGFSDALVSWKLQEHQYFTNGDDLYVLFLQPSGKYLLCTQSCSNKKLK